LSSIAGVCSGLSRRRSRVRARFSRVPFGSEMGANENGPQAAFLSLQMTMRSSEGGGGNAFTTLRESCWDTPVPQAARSGARQFQLCEVCVIAPGRRVMSTGGVENRPWERPRAGRIARLASSWSGSLVDRRRATVGLHRVAQRRIVAQLPQRLLKGVGLSWNSTPAAISHPGAADGLAPNPRGRHEKNLPHDAL